MKSVRVVTAGDPHHLRHIILLAVGLASTATACAVLLGWSLDITILKSVLPKLTPMNPMSALSFFLLGLSFMTLSLRRTSPWFSKLLITLTSAVLVLIGGLMILHYGSHIDAKIDRLLFTGRLSINRMAPSTAACFLFSGLALWLSRFYPRQKIIIRLLAFTTAFIATYTLIGYAYGLQPIYGVALLNPMALNVSILFIITSIAIISLITESFIIYITAPLIAIYAVAIAIFISLSIYSFRTFSHLNTNNIMLQQNYQQQATVDGLRTALLDAETGQRGYILTGDPAYLQPYNNALTREGTRLKQFNQLPATILSRASAERVTALTNSKLAELKLTIAVRDTSGPVAATRLVEAGQGKAYMDQIRSLLDTADQHIKHQLEVNARLAVTQSSKSLLLLSISTASILALLLASLYFLQANLKRQHDANETAQADRASTMEKNHNLEAEVSNRLLELENVKASLEIEVAKRTEELKTELQRTKQLNSFMIDRELRIKDLKDEIAVLKKSNAK